MQYKKYLGSELAWMKKYDLSWFPGKKDGKRSGRVEFQGRCVRHLNSESHLWPMSLCKECYSLTSADQGGLKDLWHEGSIESKFSGHQDPRGRQRLAWLFQTTRIMLGAMPLQGDLFLLSFYFFHFSNRPIFAGLESKFGLIFPKTALINNLDGHWVYIFVSKQLL